MFVCYQTSIERQFEYIQRRANDPGFVSGKQRPSGGMVMPGFGPDHRAGGGQWSAPDG